MLGFTSAKAQNFTNNYTGTIVTDTITVSGSYFITAVGAAGGNGYANSGIGGSGALMSGSIYLTNGTVLDIVVGGAGATGTSTGSLWGGGGGGGGTFIYSATFFPLLVAGGGGGGSHSGGGGFDQAGIAASTGQSGQDGMALR